MHQQNSSASTGNKETQKQGRERKKRGKEEEEVTEKRSVKDREKYMKRLIKQSEDERRLSASTSPFSLLINLYCINHFIHYLTTGQDRVKAKQ